MCDSSLNCEMSDLESLCEEVLEDDESSVSNKNYNDADSRNKRSVALHSSTPESTTPTSSITSVPTKYPNLLNPNYISLTSRQRRIYQTSRARRKWSILRNKRRRRSRRTRIKLLFKMIGKI